MAVVSQDLMYMIGLWIFFGVVMMWSWINAQKKQKLQEKEFEERTKEMTNRLVALEEGFKNAGIKDSTV